ncbi:hypothetical protein [Sphingomonas sp. Leaf20]|uniref:hypothetical protein n=1 Tax=Sphingomonas sp. Leaf20 TaxID=1735685 RepID=UPI000AB06F6E|nr:hypothetical protein [Sphingomonas sp. Leaf20]
MKRKKLAADPVTEVNGLSIAKWDDEWKLVPQGFVAPQRKLRHKVGLWAATRGSKFFYIAAAANKRGSGLSGGLARSYVKNSSGDKGWGLKTLRQRSAELDAYVITMDRSPENIKIIGALKKAMMQRHDPEWNRPEAITSAAREASYESRAKR